VAKSIPELFPKVESMKLFVANDGCTELITILRDGSEEVKIGSFRRAAEFRMRTVVWHCA
jgi:hypothetical protein